MHLKWKLNSIVYRNLQQIHRTWIRTSISLSYKVLGYSTLEKEQPPILLLHGLFGRKYLWKGIGKTIKNMTRRTVMIVDLRDHGASPYANSLKYDEMATDVLHLLDKLNINRASLVGHCIGGRTAMCAALLAPKRISSIVIVDISPVSTPKEFKETIQILEAIKNVSLKDFKYPAKARREARKQLRQAVADDITMTAIVSNIAVKHDGKIGWLFNLDVMIKHFKYLISFPNYLKKMQYGGPCLFIGGQLSEYIPADDLTQIRDIFPHAVVKYIPKTGHNLYVEDPKSFLELTISFYKRHS